MAAGYSLRVTEPSRDAICIKVTTYLRQAFRVHVTAR